MASPAHALLRFIQFSKQFTHFDLHRLQRLSAARRGPIDLPVRLPVALFRRTQVALLFEPVQEWIKRSKTDPITVPGQFLGHFHPEDRSFHGMMKNMETDQASVEIAVLKGIINIV